jgi:histidinol-phosphate/aromatic aminotransferase/cobyric acid decarboxylase-like protein
LSGAALVSGGVRELKKLLEELKEVKGGAVFVDEAYQLNPKEDKEGS